MKIGNFDLEKDGTYIIAELSANHGGKISIAKQTIKAAKEIGANAIKIQTYTAETITLDCDKDDFIIKGGTLWDDKKLFDLYKEAYLPWEWHQELFDYAREIGIDIFSSPFDKTAVDLLEKLNPSAYKIASFEITDYELIRYVASKGKPVIISTGIATIEEIQDAVNICRDENNDEIVLLKCTSAYPASLESANLNTIPNLSQTFQVTSGFSDHTLGGADCEFSLDKTEFKQMIQAIRDTEKLLGTVDYSMDEKKQKNRRFSRSLYIAEDIKKGDVFTKKNIRSVRPGYGLHPKYLQDILGKVADRNLSFGTPLAFKYIQGN